MRNRPDHREASPYYFKYIDAVADDDVISVLKKQLQYASEALATISEEDSQRRYAAGKWSVKQVLSHVNDAERVFAFRAFWFARGFDSALPSFDQDASAAMFSADAISWKAHLEEFLAIRRSTLSLFAHLPPDQWSRSGIASDATFTVRALAFIIAGHFEHHVRALGHSYNMAAVKSR